jgi:aspartate racemase
MKTVGIIGGIGPESTMEYYRFIIAGYRARQADGTYPNIIINSINLTKLRGLVMANELTAVADLSGYRNRKIGARGRRFWSPRLEHTTHCLRRT